MIYQQAIEVRKRQINGQPVDPAELAQANRVIAHQRTVSSAFHNEPTYTAPAQRSAPAPAPVARTTLPRGCISVDEWLRTLPPSESYRTYRT